MRHSVGVGVGGQPAVPRARPSTQQTPLLGPSLSPQPAPYTIDCPEPHSPPPPAGQPRASSSSTSKQHATWPASSMSRSASDTALAAAILLKRGSGGRASAGVRSVSNGRHLDPLGRRRDAWWRRRGRATCRLCKAWWRPLAMSVVLALVLLLLGVTRWKHLDWHAWVALGATGGTLVALGSEMTQPAAVFLGAMAVIVVTGTLTLADALSGFSTPLVFAIAGMYSFSRGIQESTLLGCVVRACAATRTRTLAHARSQTPTHLHAHAHTHACVPPPTTHPAPPPTTAPHAATP